MAYTGPPSFQNLEPPLDSVIRDDYLLCLMLLIVLFRANLDYSYNLPIATSDNLSVLFKSNLNKKQ